MGTDLVDSDNKKESFARSEAKRSDLVGAKAPTLLLTYRTLHDGPLTETHSNAEVP